ncbi:hypothetical protein [Bradyrhizobium erythrophlei]|uniref:hypothetical protein n=1 Tax=Bradyrhizobium erythrophlei TaxID=1437360 RepID=UPI0009A7F999|nr:hypothetical protein [Bradyrhizobium erythrophlei]
MRLIIAMLLRPLIVSLALLLVCCAHKPASNFDTMASCTEKFPTDKEFMTMAYPVLYKWSIAAKMAQDNIATATAVGQPIDPCTAALAYKGYTIIDQAMKYH